MVWGHTWTPRKVGERLIVAFAELPNTPVYSPRACDLRPVAGQIVTSLELLMLTNEVLGYASPERVMLLTWARAMATRDSVRSICRNREDWPRSTLYNRRERALEALATAIARGERGWTRPLTVGPLAAEV